MTEGTQARPERVMVLEPDAERRQMLAQTLMQSGFRCFMADSVHDLSLIHISEPTRH